MLIRRRMSLERTLFQFKHITQRLCDAARQNGSTGGQNRGYEVGGDNSWHSRSIMVDMAPDILVTCGLAVSV